MQQTDDGQVDEAVEFRLIVWRTTPTGWHARVTSAEAGEREFESPFELARYLAWPWQVDGSRAHGLR